MTRMIRMIPWAVRRLTARKAASQRSALLVVAILAVPLGMAGMASCSRRASTSNGDGVAGVGDTGSVGFELTLSSAAEVLTVKYTITGNGIAPITRTIDVTNSATARAVVTGIPAGTGYMVELTAVSTDKKTTCAGSATFNIVDGQTAQANIVLQCKGPGAGSSGGVTIGGTFDNCPIVKSVTIAPLSAPFGGTIKLDASASDPDGDTIFYAWSESPAVGAFMNGSVASTTFTCTLTTGGATTLTLALTDGTCTSKVVVQVTCCAGSSTTCGAGAGGGTGTGGAGMGTGGAGTGTGTGGTGTGGTGAAAGATGTGGRGSGGAGGSVLVGGNGGGAGSGTGGNSGAGVGPGGTSGANGTAGAGGRSGGAGASGTGGAAGNSCSKPPTSCVSQSCVDCTALNCSVSTDGCDPITDPAEKELCENLYACAAAPTHPGASITGPCTSAGDPTQCWCGTNPTTCLTTVTGPMAGNGPCLQEVFAAAHSMDPATIRLRFIDPSFALGRAFNLVSCRGAFCGTAPETGNSECPIP